MFNLTFTDKYGNTVTNLTQWDMNQDLYIEANIFNKIPQFHFCNKNSEKALVVRAIVEGDLLKISVPNVLLIEPYPITIYAYITDLEEDVRIGKTVEYVQLPVRPRPEPDSFTYENNVEIIDLQEIADEIIVLNEESKLATTRANAAAQACEDLLNTKGVSGGIASLDENGKVPLEQLPDNIEAEGVPKIYGYTPVASETLLITDSNEGALRIELPLNDDNFIENDTEDYLVSFKVSITSTYVMDYNFTVMTHRDSYGDKYVHVNSITVNKDDYFDEYFSEKEIRFAEGDDNPFVLFIGNADTYWYTGKSDEANVVIKDISYQLISGSRNKEESCELWSNGWCLSIENEIPDVTPYEIQKIAMPTKTSELENDSEFITATDAKAMPTTSKGNPNRAGWWWRIAEYDCTANPNQLTDSPHSCVLTLKYSYSTSNYYKISFYSTGYDHRFNLLEANCLRFENVISKIRFVKDSAKAYLEVYHQSVKPSYGATLSCTVHDGSGAFNFKWKAVTPKQIADEVEGLTVVTTYDLTAYSKIATSSDLYRFSGQSRTVTSSLLNNLSSLCAGDSGYHNFYISSSYTGDDLPNDGYKDCYATVYYSDHQPFVILWGNKKEGSQKIVINRRINYTTWTGWETLITSGEYKAPEEHVFDLGTVSNALSGAKRYIKIKTPLTIPYVSQCITNDGTEIYPNFEYLLSYKVRLEYSYDSSDCCDWAEYVINGHLEAGDGWTQSRSVGFSNYNTEIEIDNLNKESLGNCPTYFRHQVLEDVDNVFSDTLISKFDINTDELVIDNKIVPTMFMHTGSKCAISKLKVIISDIKYTNLNGEGSNEAIVALTNEIINSVGDWEVTLESEISGESYSYNNHSDIINPGITSYAENMLSSFDNKVLSESKEIDTSSWVGWYSVAQTDSLESFNATISARTSKGMQNTDICFTYLGYGGDGALDEKDINLSSTSNIYNTQIFNKARIIQKDSLYYLEVYTMSGYSGYIITKITPNRNSTNTSFNRGKKWELIRSSTTDTDTFTVLVECDLSQGIETLTTLDKGVANGIATLNEDGKLPAEQLPDGLGGGSASFFENLTATVDELNYLSGVTSNVQEQIDDKVGSTDLISKIQSAGFNMFKTTSFARAGAYWFKIAKITNIRGYSGEPSPFTLYMSARKYVPIEGKDNYYRQEVHAQFSSMLGIQLSTIQEIDLNNFKLDVLYESYNSGYGRFVSKLRVVQDKQGYLYIEMYAENIDEYVQYTFDIETHDGTVCQWETMTPEVDNGDNIDLILAECDTTQNIKQLTTANSSPVSVTNVEPTDTKALWVDTTDMSAIKLKIYNTETSAWVSIN